MCGAGLFRDKVDCIVDVSLSDLDGDAYRGRDPMRVLELREEAKRATYRQECRRQGIDFAAAVASVDGVLAPQLEAILRRVVERMGKADRFAARSHIAGMLRARLQLAILRAASMCLRMSRSREERAGPDYDPAEEPLWDGAAVAAADPPRDALLEGA